jgi:hypothetical protein
MEPRAQFNQLQSASSIEPSPAAQHDQPAEREGFEPSVQLNAIRRFSKPVPSATRPSLQMAAPACQKHTGERDLRDALHPNHLRDTIQLSAPAEEEGFEPPELALGGFQDRCLRPLGHSSRRSQRQEAQYRDHHSLVKYDLRESGGVSILASLPAHDVRTKPRGPMTSGYPMRSTPPI